MFYWEGMIMNLKDFSDIILTLIDKVDKIWNFFFISNVSIAVWFITKKDVIALEYIIFASVLYTSYTITNYFKQLRAYAFLKLALDELKLNIDDIDIKSENLVNNLKDLKYNNRHYLTSLVYLIALIFTNYIMWVGYVKS